MIGVPGCRSWGRVFNVRAAFLGESAQLPQLAAWPSDRPRMGVHNYLSLSAGQTGLMDLFSLHGQSAGVVPHKLDRVRGSEGVRHGGEGIIIKYLYVGLEVVGDGSRQTI